MGIIIGVAYMFFFSALLVGNDTKYVYIDNDDNIDSVYTKLSEFSSKGTQMTGFKMLVNNSKYADNIRTGRYAVRPGEGAFVVFRHLKNGLQTPVNLVVPSVRTVDRLAAEFSKKLMLDSATIYHALADEATCSKYGYDTATIAAMFIPNTYDIYWNVSTEKLLDRMHKECNKFWNNERTDKAKAMKLTYKDDEYLYIAEGFGTKETGGYSITVNQFYVKDKAMYFDTRLIAPDEGEKVSNQASYPYIVIKTELSEMPVVFE